MAARLPNRYVPQYRTSCCFALLGNPDNYSFLGHPETGC